MLRISARTASALATNTVREGFIMQLRSIILSSIFVLTVTTAHADGTATGVRVRAEQRRAPAVARIYDAATRNVGPTSSVSGYAESDMGSAASGNDANPHAPAAGGTGMGGN